MPNMSEPDRRNNSEPIISPLNTSAFETQPPAAPAYLVSVEPKTYHGALRVVRDIVPCVLEPVLWSHGARSSADDGGAKFLQTISAMATVASATFAGITACALVQGIAGLKGEIFLIGAVGTAVLAPATYGLYRLTRHLSDHLVELNRFYVEEYRRKNAAAASSETVK